MDKRNYTMLCDFYELTMANGYFESGKSGEIAYFDMFFRTVPDGGGFAVAAGLEQALRYIEKLEFTSSDIEFLRSKHIFTEDFLKYLSDFHFSGDIFAVPEGTVVFPQEPLIVVRAPIIEAQLIETFLLMSINHQSLIATKASRIVRAASGKAVSEFGSRRAQGADGAVLGARAAYIAGCSGSACTLADSAYGVPSGGTMAHSWVQMFDSEYEAFKTYCKLYPHNTTLLVDTYDVLNSGVPNAIRAFKETLVPLGAESFAVRLDSGDLAYLSARVREMLDEAGLFQCKIVVSNALDEYLIRDLLLQGAKIDAFGVGERLITSKSDPVFNGVYKLAAISRGGEIIPKIKISENETKITNPHFKKLYRLYDRKSGKAEADLICVHDECIDDLHPLTIFDPDFIWKRKTLTNFRARELLVPVFIKGELVYKLPGIEEIRQYRENEVNSLWDEVLRFENPHNYYVDLSQKLWDIKNNLLTKLTKLKGSK